MSKDIKYGNEEENEKKENEKKENEKKENEKKEEELKELLRMIEERKNNYGILDVDIINGKNGKPPIQKQVELFTELRDRLSTQLNERIRYMLYYGGNGAGKCHQYSDKVLGYDGMWKLAGEIQVGDILMGPDSKPRTVNAIGGGYGKMYKITPESGEPVRVNGDHQLYLVHRRRSKKGERGINKLDYAPEGNIVQISVEDYLKKSNKWKAEAYMWRPNKIDYDKKLLPIDPYFLGVWLGDGNTNSPGVTSIDKEIIDYTSNYAKSLGLSLRKSGITYFMKKEVRSRYGFSGYSLLREAGVLGDKHIPIDYLTGSEEQRLELLAGLIDTDGEVNSATPRYSITQKSEKLSRDIMQLARSLGFRSSIVKTVKNCTNHTREDYTPGAYYRVSINGDVWRIPVKLERKRFSEQARRHNKDWRVSKFLVEEDGEDNFYGFSLDGDHLYLDYNFIIQHNTFIGSYICVLLALGHKTADYNLPFIGAKKNIWIATKSGNNVKTTIHKYLLGDGSPTRIPPEMVKKAHIDNNILKGIYLTNGCKINIVTYDQGREAIQGDTPDFLWMDEEPTNEEVWTELRFRTRGEDCETLITMTPLSGLTPVYKFFFEQSSQEVRDKSRIYHVSAIDNPYTDKTLTKGLTDEEYRLRVEGSFENPTGLVYNEFFRSKCVVPHFEPGKLSGNYGDPVKYYRAIDFGTSHPTAVVWVAQDIDDNLYVYDELEVKDTPLSTIVDTINQKSIGYNFEYTVRDSASAREGLEVEKLGLKTVKANKFEKGANDMSNRRTGIMIINDLFAKGKLVISDRCVRLIRELETHYYKENGTSVVRKDGDVNKFNDDLLDALRYVIFMIKRNTGKNKKSLFLKDFDKKYGKSEKIRLL